jgi:hypothetical protein
VIHFARRHYLPVLSPNPYELTGFGRADSQMILLRYLRDLRKPAAKVQGAADIKPRVLNVGGGSKDIPLPLHYANWRHDLLDIDPKGKPDAICGCGLAMPRSSSGCESRSGNH